MGLGEWMEREIRVQPEVLAAKYEEYGQLSGWLADQRPDLVLLAARGSSDNAALYARYLIEIHLGIPVVLAAPSVLTRYGSRVNYPGRTLAIGISQSGAAPDVAEVLAALREQGHATLAITNTEGSRLTQVAEQSLLLNVGEEKSIAATKTYTASLLALAQVVRGLASGLGRGDEIPDPAAYLPTEEWMETTRTAARRNSWAIIRCSPVFTLARGYGYATALETALKLMECALISAKSYSTADFEHGPKALLGESVACVVYGEVPASLAGTGTVAVQAPTIPDHVPALYHPLWDVIFGQWLALRAARARGYDPDAAQNLSKVTKTL
jgi:glucosamine--fructose-6-phosphate aminotransferase (isomerizing)